MLLDLGQGDDRQLVLVGRDVEVHGLGGGLFAFILYGLEVVCRVVHGVQDDVGHADALAEVGGGPEEGAGGESQGRTGEKAELEIKKKGWRSFTASFTLYNYK